MRTQRTFYGALPIIMLIVLWEAVARLKLAPGNFLPPFSLVLEELFYMTVNGVLLSNLARSLARVMIGFSLGSALGIAVGIMMGYSRVMHELLNPIISFLYPIPALGWLPLLMLWVGVGEMLPITIIFICSFFPTAYTTATGVRNVDKRLVRAAETLGASPKNVLKTVVLPLALPTIFTGLRLEAGMAWRVIVAAEMVAIPTGIGALFMQAESLIRMDIIIACLMVLAIMCFLFERIFQYLETKVCRWVKPYGQG